MKMKCREMDKLNVGGISGSSKAFKKVRGKTFQ